MTRSKTKAAPAAGVAKSRAASIGHFAPIALAVGLGLLICSVADALSRATLAHAMPVYWVGVLVIALPLLYRLTSEEASVRERLALVCLLGLALYAVKVMRDAPIYTFSDELAHAYNAEQISTHNHLFHHNPILSVTPRYPGLEGAASALMSLTGLSSFVAGVLLIGSARLVMVAAMFFLFRRVSGSARIAGLGAAAFAGNFNFFFWDAQFSYESLALPLLLMAMMALAEREASSRTLLGAWAVPVLLATAAIVVTHHLTSYALVVVLTGLALATWWVRRDWRPPNPWPFAVVAFGLSLAWLVVVASSTIGYLSPVLSDAVTAIVEHRLAGGTGPRHLPRRWLDRRRHAVRSPRGGGAGRIAPARRPALRPASDPPPLHEAALCPALRAFRDRLLLHARPAVGARRLGDRQSLQRVLLHRPRLPGRLRRPRGPAALVGARA